MKQKLGFTLPTCLAYCIDNELYQAVAYLKEQVRVLVEPQKKDKRILLNSCQRIRMRKRFGCVTSHDDMIAGGYDMWV